MLIAGQLLDERVLRYSDSITAHRSRPRYNLVGLYHQHVNLRRLDGPS